MGAGEFQTERDQWRNVFSGLGMKEALDMIGREKSPDSNDLLAVRKAFLAIIDLLNMREKRTPAKEVAQERRSIEGCVEDLRKKIDTAHVEVRPALEGAVKELKAALIIAHSDAMITREEALAQLGRRR